MSVTERIAARGVSEGDRLRLTFEHTSIGFEHVTYDGSVTRAMVQERSGRTAQFTFKPDEGQGLYHVEAWSGVVLDRSYKRVGKLINVERIRPTPDVPRLTPHET